MELLVDLFTKQWLFLLISCAAAYLISSVNTSIIVTSIVIHKDIRNEGSGNAGFTNVLRSVGKGPAIITFIGDFLKGVISVLIPYFLTFGWDGIELQQERQMLMYLAGLFAVVGHMFPLYYHFKGGKGVVTTASVMLMTDWRVLVIALVIFGVFFVLTKTISKCSLVCAGTYPFVGSCLRLLDSSADFPTLAPIANTSPVLIGFIFAVTFIIALMIIIKHKDNIRRILDGTEKKITPKRKEAKA